MSQPWRVICLCADWCGTCRDYQPVFDAVAACYPAHAFDWIDVEDQAERIGDIDIETFPTLLMLRGEQAQFFGPVLPHSDTLVRMIKSLQDDPDGLSADPQARALTDRLLAHAD